jgi:hypothetical protein
MSTSRFPVALLVIFAVAASAARPAHAQGSVCPIYLVVFNELIW